MLHTLKYSMRTVIRNWSACFWLILFPMILGTLFKIALSNLGVPLERIPVAVVTAENAGKQEIETFRRAADNLGEEDLLEIRYCEKEEALELLEKEEVEGILTVGKRISLSISGKSYNDRKNMNRNILNTFVNRYNLSADAIAEIAVNHPEHLEDVVSGMREEHFYNREESLSATKGDNYVAYFYNLLAMTCMFCSMSGLEISLNNQGNLTALGARRNISPMPKQSSILGELAAYVLVNFGCILIGFAYINLVLRVDLTSRLPLTLLTLFVSDMTGSAFGFFLGAIGRMSERTKNAIAVGVSLICCFLSGLMVGTMRGFIENRIPVLNRINPTALISDSFYCLANFDTYSRYTRNMVSLCIATAVFLTGGFLLTRRRQYASL